MEGAVWGGSEELWYRTALAALAQQHRVTICIFHWNEEPVAIQHLRKAGAQIVKVQRKAAYPLFKRIKQRVAGEGSIKEFAKLIAFKPDVICVSQGGTFDLGYNTPFYQLVKRLAKPYMIISQHNVENGGIVPSIFRNQIIEALNNAVHIYFVAERNKKVAERQLAYSIHNTSVISNPVNLTSTGVKQFPSMEQGLQMACVARLDCGYKGQDILLEVLSNHKWRERQFYLNLFGKGPHEEHLRYLIELYKLGNKVTLVGKTNDIDEVWQQHHVLLLPSLSEGTPLSMLEAMLCGRAVVATNVGGIADYIVNGVTGFLAPVASVEALDTALENMWQEKQRLAAIGLAAYEHAMAITDLQPQETLLSKLLTIV